MEPPPAPRELSPHRGRPKPQEGPVAGPTASTLAQPWPRDLPVTVWGKKEQGETSASQAGVSGVLIHLQLLPCPQPSPKTM